MTLYPNSNIRPRYVHFRSILRRYVHGRIMYVLKTYNIVRTFEVPSVRTMYVHFWYINVRMLCVCTFYVQFCYIYVRTFYACYVCTLYVHSSYSCVRTFDSLVSTYTVHTFVVRTYIPLIHFEVFCLYV